MRLVCIQFNVTTKLQRDVTEKSLCHDYHSTETNTRPQQPARCGIVIDNVGQNQSDGLVQSLTGARTGLVAHSGLG